jgi:nucleoside-diphosphate-sugar epimerase
MKKIIILGANSFAGTSFVNYLLKKNIKFFRQADLMKKKIPLIFTKRILINKTIGLIE